MARVRYIDFFFKLHAAVENSTTLVRLLQSTIPLLKLIWSYKFGIANYYANFLCRLWRGKEAIQNWRHPGQAASKSNVRIMIFLVKFIYSDKATKFCKIFTLLFTVCTVVKIKMKILQNSVVFSEYTNFNRLSVPLFKQIKKNFLSTAQKKDKILKI